MPGLDYSIPGLVAAAGTDPWELARAVTDARPDTVRFIGETFRARGADAGEVARSGGLADTAAATAYSTDGQPVFDAPGSAQQGRRLLSDDGAALVDTGAVLTRLADDLADAQFGARRRLDAVTADVNAVIVARNAFFAEQGRLLPAEADAADRGFHADAVGFVAHGSAGVQEILDGFDRQVAGHTAAIGELPHAPLQPPATSEAPPRGPSGPMEVAGAVGAGLVNGLASLGNAVVHNPGEALAFAGGVALAGISAVGVAGGSLATATGVGAAPGIPVTGASLAGVVTGGAIATVAGAEILRDAVGADRVSPLGSNPFGDTVPAAAAVAAPTMIDAAGNAWDRNSTWEQVPSAIPAGKDIAHDGGSRSHIPWGTYHDDGRVTGGHWHGAGVADKTVFPKSWDTETILERTLDVARNPDQVPVFDPENERWQALGTREGVEIKVVLEADGTIVTAHPIRGPGVQVTDENGDPHPPGN